jgi:hypothetical protein
MISTAQPSSASIQACRHRCSLGRPTTFSLGEVAPRVLEHLGHRCPTLQVDGVDFRGQHQAARVDQEVSFLPLSFFALS